MKLPLFRPREHSSQRVRRGTHQEQGHRGQGGGEGRGEERMLIWVGKKTLEKKPKLQDLECITLSSRWCRGANLQANALVVHRATCSMKSLSGRSHPGPRCKDPWRGREGGKDEGWMPRAPSAVIRTSAQLPPGDPVSDSSFSPSWGRWKLRAAQAAARSFRLEEKKKRAGGSEEFMVRTDKRAPVTEAPGGPQRGIKGEELLFINRFSPSLYCFFFIDQDALLCA